MFVIPHQVSPVEEGSPHRASRAPGLKGPTSSAAPSTSAAAATPALAAGGLLVHVSTACSQPVPASAAPHSSTAPAAQHPHMAMRSSSRSSKDVHLGSSIEGNSSAAAAAAATGHDSGPGPSLRHRGVDEQGVSNTGRRQHGAAACSTPAASLGRGHDQLQHKKQNGMHASDTDPSSEADDDALTPDANDSHTAAGPQARRAGRKLTSQPFLADALTDGGEQGAGEEGGAAGSGEGGGGGGVLRAKIPKLPMVRSGRKWYRARLMKEAGGQVLLESSCKGSEGATPFWLPKESDRIWHGSYKGRDWKYLVSADWVGLFGTSESDQDK